MKNKHIHFIGICGVAMSALAIAFHKEGWEVTGSDVGFFPPISDYLKNNNISFYPGWHPEKMTANGNPDIIVVGNVAGSANPEFIYARKNNLNYKSYPEVIAEYIVQKNSLVCAGTYGKTSTTALLTLILEKAGINTSYMFGGLSLNLPNSAKIIPRLGGEDLDDQPTPTPPKRGIDGWSVLEGDEYKTARWDSRPKFKLYSPTHLLLTSVSWDHADIYPTEETYLQAFKDLVGMIPNNGLIVACTDDLKIKNVLKSNTNETKIVTYGKNEPADYCYANLKQTSAGISFTIKHQSKETVIHAPVLGEHMAENICGAFALAKEINIDEEVIINTIAEFKGIKRRLEKRSEGKIAIYDDLGHSPTKAAATLKTLRDIYPTNKIIAIFEPNTGNRKSQSAPSYANAFNNADEVIIPLLTKIKIDPNDIDPPFDGEKLAEIISQTHPNTIFIDNDDKLIEHVKNNTKKEDITVFLGSHGFRGMIEKLMETN
ncbi:MAG TPA: Mur ligase family protein [Candidatus Udaeobacter sp.]|nr:Mur ligase family protein [Candidatus Udaeobacter sp.]